VSYQGCNFVLLHHALLFAVASLKFIDLRMFGKEDKIVLIHAMKACRRTEVLLHSFVVFLVNGRDRSAVCLCTFTSGKEFPVTY
jgi:hypothetical protein